ncbi:MAG: 3'-5' exonuclease, partial [Candidatus Binatia bacterium]
MQDALRELGVPAALQGDRSVFESEEAREAALVLEAMADPSDPRLLRAALATTLLGRRGDDLARLESDESRFDEESAFFVDRHDEWVRHGFMRAFRRLLDERQVAQRLLGLPKGERRLTNVLHVAELLHKAAVTAHRGPHELVEWLRREIEEGHRAGELAPEELQIRLESDADAVVLTTIHKAKGLEYPVVFCPWLWTKSGLWGDDARRVRFHDETRRPALDLGSERFEEHGRKAEEEQRAEDLRLLYVALTRARHQCSIVWGGFYEAEFSPLARFLSAPEIDLGDDGAILAHLRKVEEASRGGIAVREMSLDPPPPWRAERAGAELEGRTFRRSL